MLSAKARGGPSPRPYRRNKNVQWGRFDLTDLLVVHFDDDELERFRVVPGDLLVCEGGEVGRAAIWRGQIDEVAYQKALHRVRPSPGVAAEYLLYAFRWFADTHAFESFMTGSTINHLPQEDLRRLPITLPPEAEQRRIVEAVDEHFSRIEAIEDRRHNRYAHRPFRARAWTNRRPPPLDPRAGVQRQARSAGPDRRAGVHAPRADRGTAVGEAAEAACTRWRLMPAAETTIQRRTLRR